MSLGMGMSPAAPQALAPSRGVPARAAKNPYMQPAFLAAVIVLAASAAALNFLVFNRFQVSLDKPLDPDLQEVLGTDKYIYRDYLSLTAQNGDCAARFIALLHSTDEPAQLATALAAYLPADKMNALLATAKTESPAEQRSTYLDALHTEYMNRSDADRVAMLQADIANKSAETRAIALATVQEQFPEAAINMGITYYTGLVDTVAHVPDRCYIADGFEPTDYDFPKWTLPATGRQLGVRFINFQDSSGKARVDRSVAYFFHVDGHYASNPLDVRLSLENLFEKYGYYEKVELMTLDPDDANHDRSVRTMTTFLDSALGEVEKSLPDWNKLHPTTK